MLDRVAFVRAAVLARTTHVQPWKSTARVHAFTTHHLLEPHECAHARGRGLRRPRRVNEGVATLKRYSP